MVPRKVPARFHRGSTSFVLSPVLWGGLSWPAKRWFHQGSSKGAPRDCNGNLMYPPVEIRIRHWSAENVHTELNDRNRFR